MNDLQRYMDLCGITCTDIAAGTRLGYHSVQKVVKGHRRAPKIRAAIAYYLGLDPDKLWGRGAAMYLRARIAVEAARQAEAKRLEILSKYIPDGANIAPKRRAVNV